MADAGHDPPSLWVDFQAMLDRDTVPLHLSGTRADIERQGLEIREGLTLRLWDEDLDDEGNRDDLVAEGIAAWHAAHHIWVCRLTAPVRHQSELP